MISDILTSFLNKKIMIISYDFIFLYISIYSYLEDKTCISQEIIKKLTKYTKFRGRFLIKEDNIKKRTCQKEGHVKSSLFIITP